MMMQAISLLAVTEVDRIRPRRVDVPEPRAGQVLIKMIAAGLNPMDWESASGATAWVETFPHTLGNEGAGRIVAVGEGVHGLALGDLVVAYNFGNSPGMLAEYNVVDAQNLTSLPPGLDPVAWAASPIGLLSIYHAFYKRGLAGAGSRVLIEGTGGVGAFAIQWAKALDWRVAVLSTSRSAAWAEELGADKVYTTELSEEVLEKELRAFSPTGFDLVFSTLGGTAIARLGGFLAKNARFVSTMPISAPTGMEGMHIASLNSRSMSAIFGQNSWEWFLAEPDGKTLGWMLSEAVRLGIQCPIAAEYQIDDASSALSRAVAGGNRGKIVVRLG